MSFTSDLSVSEFALATEAGLRPLRLVGGAGVFRLPPPVRQTDGGYLRPGQTVPLTGQANRWNHARATVLSRLRNEARTCGADLVIGVSLRWRVPRHHAAPGEPAAWYQEFTATGTAMTRTGAAAPGPAGDGPVLTNLRVPDYWKLIQQGYAPAGLVTATAVAAGRSSWEYDPPSSPGYQSATAQRQAVQRQPGTLSRGLQDRPEYHAITRQAYSAALEKLRADATVLNAPTVTGVGIERTRAEWSLNEFSKRTAVFVHATGTALTSAPSPGRPAPLTIMPIRHLDR